MAERFNLSENDRFTMLSGIAHDPIQRDIFTPLFLGAQILVPAKVLYLLLHYISIFED